MELTFFGVRGSTPTPGAEFVRYGGNTACVYVRLDDGTHIALDSGTGIVGLGKQLIKESGDIHILLSHNHWDHIQGFPFFAPIYQKDRKIHITPGMTKLAEHDAILKQMSGSLFPVSYDTLTSLISITPRPEQEMQWQLNSAVISRLAMNHPGSGSSYCIQADGVKIAYITDNELYPPYRKETDFLQFVEFAMDADMIIHDAQYLFSDLPAKSGWGHSIAEEAVKLALACRAKRLALYSHDPIRTDDSLDKLQARCREIVQIADDSLEVFAAAEGMTFSLSNKS
ncbi:MBL fold metallo-hydrolase [Bowmanella sp. JS7-9]|uniref:MBL fold metallo-hydrolase n=1 Tax=Pseudobowmanella zhangzhouensis TaxID=1537679 RepID=A0ABW1XI66_9ALTE|nr:MBL fold metallo-hydrolase [Bowmanella sp. JS7-9]TBX25620.1 beta-lactamase [Bowmanella sp. JS7-9]